ncbi:MAG TPA: YfhO family protein, partial [Bryobacteraceae bacterium]|nr:YfhO family protein [Bryobacteraceae bacterium]
MLQPILFYWRVLINPSSHIPYDIEGFHLPLISYIGQCLRRGVAPLWDPYPYCGVPFHADLTTALFYPFTWLAVLAGNHSQGRNLLYWVEALDPLHMILAGLFTFLLLRRMELCRPAALLGASVYQLGGYFASQAQHLGAISTGAWLPLAILAVFELRDRMRVRWIAVLAIAVAMSILAGYSAASLVVAGAVALLVIALLAVRDASWRIIPSVAIGFLAGAIISVVELVPLWQLSHASLAGHRPIAASTGGGMAWQALVSLVIPNYFHIFDIENYRLTINFTYLYVYCGIATVILIVLAPLFRRSRAPLFLILTIISAVWMLGEHTPVYRFVFVHLPVILRSALYAEFALMAFCCFAGITAALVLDRIGNRAPQALLWAVAIFTSYDLIHTGSGRPMNSHRGGYKNEDSEYQIAGSPARLALLRPLLDQTNPPTRVDFTDQAFSQGFLGSEMTGLPTANGDNPFVLNRILRLRWLFATGRPWDRQLSVNRLDSPILDMLGVGFLVSGSELTADKLNRARLEYVNSVEGLWVYRNPHALSRFFLAPRVRRSSGEEETFRLLADPGFDPRREAIVEGMPRDQEFAGGAVQMRLYTPNRVQLSVAAAGPAFLATSEPMYSGWEATVNGRPQSFLVTNGAFRGLTLPSGTSEVIMEYHPPHFALWLFVSLISFVASLVVSLRIDRVISRGTVAEIRSKKDHLICWLRLSAGRIRDLWNEQVVPRSVTILWVSFLLMATVLFYWRILLTRQFSLLTDSESISQQYSWLTFWVSSVRHGILPLWDPYTFSGHSFIGEMQTGGFYPLRLLLALFPLNGNGLFSPTLYHVWFASSHFLGACFMFALARELKLSRFAAFLAGICFAFGGFVARMAWPHMLESSIWLPLIFLFFLRALHAFDTRRAVLNSAIAGLMLGLSILAGGMHVVIMQALAIVAAGAYQIFSSRSLEESLPW